MTRVECRELSYSGPGGVAAVITAAVGGFSVRTGSEHLVCLAISLEIELLTWSGCQNA